VHLTGPKTGVWCDFNGSGKGDLLDLVAAVYGFNLAEALRWAHQWLGIDPGEAARPPLPASSSDPSHSGNRWRHSWQAGKPITGTPAERYLAARGLVFDDPQGLVLRFHHHLTRRHPETDELQHGLQGMLALVRSIYTGEPCGLHIVFLDRHSTARLRDRKGKVNRGQKADTAVMLSPFDAVTSGLAIAESVEDGIALYQSEVRPVWALCGVGLIRAFPVLRGIEVLTVGADADLAGREGARVCRERWESPGREVLVIEPSSAGDWAADAQRRIGEAAE
jgi:hypothetical protein